MKYWLYNEILFILDKLIINNLFQKFMFICVEESTKTISS